MSNSRYGQLKKQEINRPVVFISYSWDSEKHKEWVLDFAKDLITKYGIDVLLDQFELSAGKDLTYFMESSIEKSTKVLLIMTPNYKLKAENRAGGVGYEYSMISQELFDIQTDNNKFIPILRQGDLDTSSPKYIKSKIYHEMSNNSEYLNQLFELSRIIYEKPKLTKPELGPIPNFESIDYDPIIELAKELSTKEHLNNELNQILNSKEGISLANTEIDKLHDSIRNKATLYSEKSTFQFRAQVVSRSNLILSCGDYSVLLNWDQPFYNTLDDSKLTVSYWHGNLVLNSYDSISFPGKEPRKIRTIEYRFDLNIEKEGIWLLKDKSTMTSGEILKQSFFFIMEQIGNEKAKGFRNN